MDGKLTLEIVVPQRRLVQEEVDEVSALGPSGYFGALPGHTPYLVVLKVGEMFYRIGSERRYLSTSGGYAEVGPDKVTILAETAELGEEIEVERAQKSKERAESRLQQRDNEEIDFDRAQVSLQRALIRLQVAQKR